MPTNRSQRHQIAALTEELRGERDRRMQLELECSKLKTESDIYKQQDRWQKGLIESLTSEKRKGGAKDEEHTSATPSEFAEFIRAIETFAGKIETKSTAVTRSLGAYQKTIAADQLVSKAWTDKLDKLISALGTAESAKSPPKPVRIAKSVGNTLIDFGVGYSANLGATESSAFIHRTKANLSTGSNPTNATWPAVASSVASVTISNLPNASTVVTSAASAVTAAATLAIVTAMVVAIATILLTGVRGLAPAGDGDTQPGERVGDGDVGGESPSVEDQDAAKE